MSQKLLLFKKYYIEERNFVRTSIYWMVRTCEVDDLVQDTFVKAWKAFDDFRSEANFRTWIYRIAMNTTYDYLKKKRSESLDNAELIVDKSSNQYELTDIIDKGLAKLGLKHREVFILFYKFEYTILEISELVGINLGTVKSRLFKGRQIFQAHVKESGVEHE